MKFLIFLSLATALIFPTQTLAEAASKNESAAPETLGFVEWVVMNDTGLRLKARLDTGAKTSSLHAVNVKEFKKDDQKWVKFQIPLADHKKCEYLSLEELVEQHQAKIIKADETT